MNLHKCLKLMVEHEGSDLYLTVGSPPLMKLGEKMVALGKSSLDTDETRAVAEDIMNEEQQQEFAKNFELNTAYAPKGIGRFRVNIFVQRHQVGLVLRRIKDKIPTFKELGLPAVLKRLVMKKQGLVLVVGGTGSGKSTTLAAMIDYRNRNSYGHIVTVEDPIEFIYQHRKSIISQREIGVDTNSYAEALKNTLRQAPSVILIGEIRDAETMQKALEFAETGHLCLSTLHANNANQALERIINFFPEEAHKRVLLELSLNIRGIVSQRLITIKKTDKRVAAIEIMIATARVKELIRDGKLAEIKEVMSKENTVGMKTFDNAIYELFEEGVISKEQALQNADSETDMKLKIDMKTGKHHEKGDDLSIDEQQQDE